MAVSIEIKVVPSSGKQVMVLDKSSQIKCFLKNPPEDGKANSELLKFLSKKLKLANGDVKIIQGQTSRKKVIKIETNMTKDQVLAAIGIERQLEF